MVNRMQGSASISFRVFDEVNPMDVMAWGLVSVFRPLIAHAIGSFLGHHVPCRH